MRGAGAGFIRLCHSIYGRIPQLVQGGESASALRRYITGLPLLSPECRPKILDEVHAQAPVVIVLRNPIDQAYSNYLHHVWDGREGFITPSSQEMESPANPGRFIPDLADIIREATLRRFRETSPKKIKAILPSNLESLPPQEVEKILDDENYTKEQVINLGAQRFGISSAKLTRLGKKKVLESIRAALNHEKSLEVISKEAQRGGEMRSS